MVLRLFIVLLIAVMDIQSVGARFQVIKHCGGCASKGHDAVRGNYSRRGPEMSDTADHPIVSAGVDER